MKKKFSLILATTLAISLSACSSPKAEPSNSPTSSQTPAGATKGKLDKKFTITAFNSGAFQPGAQMPDREKDPTRQMLEKAMNIDFQMTIPPADQQKAKLNAMIAAGEIPDMIFMTDRTTATQYYDQGIVADLDSVITNYPDLQKRFKAQDWEAMKYKGKTIGTPGYEFVSGINGWWIRNDWLTKLNLKAPTTADELLEVMKAFTFNDPDGNGKNDTYGFVPGLAKDGIASATNNGGTNNNLGWAAIFWMFGINPNVVDQIDGKLIFGSTDPRMKDALAFINKMIEAKVVDPDWVSINEGPAITKKLYAGKSGIVITDWRSMEPANQTQMKEIGGEIPDWITIAPPKGPAGSPLLGLTAFQNNMWGISKTAAKDPEKLDRILSLLQYWYTDKDFYPYANYGVKTVNWNDTSGKIVVTPLTKELDEKYKWSKNYALGRRANDDLYYNFQNPKTTEFQKINQSYLKPNTTNPFVNADPSDSKYADRLKYVNEALLKFMLGKEPLTKWDEYINTLNTKFDYEKYKELTTKQLKDAGVLK